MRIRLTLVAVLWIAGCYRVPLEGHACPCVDGFVCVADVCVRDDVDAGPAESQLCPQQFLPADGCAATPPFGATLVAVCDDGNISDSELLFELGGAIGTCSNASQLTVTVTSSSAVTGSFTFETGGGDETLELELDGTVEYQVDVPETCVIDAIGCQPSDNSGTCATNGDACRCTGVELDYGTLDQLNRVGQEWFGDGQYFGCNDASGNYLLRADDSIGLGPIFVFEPN